MGRVGHGLVLLFGAWAGLSSNLKHTLSKLRTTLRITCLRPARFGPQLSHRTGAKNSSPRGQAGREGCWRLETSEGEGRRLERRLRHRLGRRLPSPRETSWDSCRQIGRSKRVRVGLAGPKQTACGHSSEHDIGPAGRQVSPSPDIAAVVCKQLHVFCFQKKMLFFFKF